MKKLKTTDILGQELPVLRVSGVSVLPPPLFVLNRHLPYLVGFMRSIIVGELNVRRLHGLYPHVNALLHTRFSGGTDAEELFAAVAEYLIFIRETIPQLPYCAAPHIADDGEDGYAFPLFTSSEKLVSDYANLPLTDVYRLNYVDFLILRREAFIYGISRTKKGREKLEEAYCREQTQPDRARLRSRFGGESDGEQ